MAADGHLIGGGIADYVVAYGDGGEVLLAAGSEVWFYNVETGGVRYTDGLTDLSGTPITSVTSDSNGGIPQLRTPGPNVVSMWADANGGAGPRRLMVANDIGEIVEDLRGRVADAENAVDNLQALADLMLLVVRYDVGTSTWPTRPDIAGPRVVVWVGPNASPPPAGYMAEGDQFWGWA